jgi:N utilization substance protein A
MEKIVDIIDSIAHEKGLEVENVKKALINAMIKTAKKTLGEDLEFEVEIDKQSKKANVFQKLIVVDKEAEDTKKYISLKEAKEIAEDVEVGDELRYPIELESLGRTAVMTLQKEFEYAIQRLVEQRLFYKYKNKIGKLISGTVIRVDNEQNTYIEIDEVKAILPMRNRIKGEFFKRGDVIKAILKKVYIDKINGFYLELSRTTPKFLEELLKLEVPELKDELIKIENIARIPGERAKVALVSFSNQVDCVGACVGVKGIRINSVSKELKNENIDCIEYSPIPEIFIARSLSPAIITNVKIKDKKAYVSLPQDQKSKAIGKNGINVRLASMLTGYEIELKEKDAHSKDSNKPKLTLKDLFKE